MKISGGLTENGVIVGNAYNKYGSKNPLVRWLMQTFDTNLAELVDKRRPASIHEVGCGEGYWTMRWLEQGFAARGSDFSETVIDLARDNAREQGQDPELFEVRSIYDLDPDVDSADLVVCCEVLEHLSHPEAGLQALREIARPHLILSVPREPLWRIMNLARGKYLSRLGNTPGHLQHWSQRWFVRLVSRYFDVEELRTPIPWTMLSCRRRNAVD